MDVTTFETYRPLLFSIAYRMVGTVMDAEDLVQETFVRVAAIDIAAMESPKAYLCSVVTRLCLNHLNSARVTRESYIGPWLPEPLITDGAALCTSPEGSAVQHDAISMAFLVLLESLTPTERAVFLLREVFDYGYDEIAAMLGKTEAACRQIFSRAHKHIADHRPRFDPTPEHQTRLVTQFLAAIEEGNVEGLAALLSEDVIVWTDGGGKVVAALKPVHGRDLAARFFMGTRRLGPEGATAEIAAVNGQPAVIIRDTTGRAHVVIMPEFDGPTIRAVHVVGNPDKLTRI